MTFSFCIQLENVVTDKPQRALADVAVPEMSAPGQLSITAFLHVACLEWGQELPQTNPAGTQGTCKSCLEWGSPRDPPGHLWVSCWSGPTRASCLACFPWMCRSGWLTSTLEKVPLCILLPLQFCTFLQKFCWREASLQADHPGFLSWSVLSNSGEVGIWGGLGKITSCWKNRKTGHSWWAELW